MKRTLLIALAAAAVAAQAETAYISDELSVPLRSGPSNAHRILHRGLPSGTAMEVLGADAEAGFTQVRTAAGTEGWIRTQYLVYQPIARARLATATQRIASLEARLADSSGTIDGVTTERDAAQRANAALDRRVQDLEAELAEIKRISAGAIEEHASNQKLAQLNERLRGEIDDLVAERNLLQDNVQQRWMLIGAGLLFGGLLIGVFIKSRPRRSGWS